MAKTTMVFRRERVYMGTRSCEDETISGSSVGLTVGPAENNIIA